MASCPSTYWVYLELQAKVTAGTAATTDYDKLICKSGITSASALAQVTASVSSHPSRTPILTPFEAFEVSCI